MPAVKNPYLAESDWGWAVDPLGLRISLCQLSDRYHLPLFVVENGFEVPWTKWNLTARSMTIIELIISKTHCSHERCDNS